MQNNMENQDWNIKEDPIFDKFNSLSTGTLNRVINIDYQAFQAKKIANTDYKARTANTDYRSFQEKRIANTNYQAFQAKRVANTNYEIRTAKIDYKSIFSKVDFETKVANTNWKIREEKRIAKILKPVLQYDKQGNFIKEWSSAKEAVTAMGKPESSDIGRCCRGKAKSAFGFIWKFKDN